MALKRLRALGRRLLRGRKARRHGMVGPAHLWRLKRDFQIRFLREHGGIEPHHRLLDIGCGTLRGGIPLIEYLDAQGYTGIESRAEALEEGRRELEEAGLADKRPRLMTDPLPEFQAEQPFDRMWAFSVLIHMTDDIVRDCFALAARCLADDGVFYANVNLGERPPGRWEEFPVMWRTAEWYEREAQAAGLEIERVGALGELGHESGTNQDDQVMLAIRKS